MSRNRKETIGNETIIARIESLKPLIEASGKIAVQSKWGLPSYKFAGSYQYREAAAWQLAGPPFNAVAEDNTIACYFHDFQTVGLNLTEFKKKLKSVKSTQAEPLNILASFIMAHESVIHPNCKSKAVLGEDKEGLVYCIQQFQQALDMDKDDPYYLKDDNVAIEVSGASLKCRLPNSRCLTIGRKIDETIATTLTFPIAASALGTITFRNPSKGFEPLSDLPVFDSENVTQEASAAFLDYHLQDPSSASLYLQGEFLDHHVFSKSGSEFMDRLHHLFFDEPLAFFNSIKS